MVKRKHILVIDDDDRLRFLLRKYLRDRNYIVSDVATAIEGLELCEFIIPEVIILDIMLPGMDGYAFAKTFTKYNKHVPIIMLSSLGQAKDRIKGLKKGAVDYLVKPFSPEELLIRINLAIKASGFYKLNNKKVILQQLDQFRSINLKSKEGSNIALTEKENQLFIAFRDQLGCVLSRSAIARLCSIEGGDRSVDVLVMRLRRKLLKLSEPMPEIKTIRGKGYVLQINSI